MGMQTRGLLMRVHDEQTTPADTSEAGPIASIAHNQRTKPFGLHMSWAHGKAGPCRAFYKRS